MLNYLFYLFIFLFIYIFIYLYFPNRTRTRDAYHDFLKCLHLYSWRVVSKKSLFELTGDSIGKELTVAKIYYY